MRTSARIDRASERASSPSTSSGGAVCWKSPNPPSMCALFCGLSGVARMRSAPSSARSTSGAWLLGLLSRSTASGSGGAALVVALASAIARATASLSSWSPSDAPTKAPLYGSTSNSRLKTWRAPESSSATCEPSPTHCASGKKTSKAPRSARSSGERPSRRAGVRRPRAARMELTSVGPYGTRQSAFKYAQKSEKPPRQVFHSASTVSRCVSRVALVSFSPSRPGSSGSAVIAPARSQSSRVSTGTSTASAKRARGRSRCAACSSSTRCRKASV